MALVLDNTDEFVEAMAADFGTRSRAATLFTEMIGMMPVIEHTRSNVARWMRATKLMRTAGLFGLRAEVQPSPLGVVGIIGPWNFPLNLVVLPAVAAFAAGNRVMIKMSEVTSQHRGPDEARRRRGTSIRPSSTSSPAAPTWRPRSPRCRSIICSSPARRRWVRWCSGPPRTTWFR